MPRKVALIILSVVATFIFLPAPNASAAFPLFKDSCKDSAGNAVDSSVCRDAAKKGGIDNLTNNITDPISGNNGIIQTAANLIALVTGIAAVIMIIFGGFAYITSAGNAEKVATARRRIVYSLVGLAVVALAWALTTFIISRFVNS